MRSSPPPTQSLRKIKKSAKSCTACPLYLKGTQTVFGEGPDQAVIMIVGEQPGDVEDRMDRNFVGPAGAVLDSALEEAGLDRSQLYLTNAVKHFKWAPRGKKRLHQKPNVQEIKACKPWLEAEIAMIKPKIILALGVTAATSVLGRLPKLTRERGKIIESPRFATKIILSWHPSSILRMPDAYEAQKRRKELVADCKLAKIQASK